jgi:hypothetical protein
VIISCKVVRDAAQFASIHISAGLKELLYGKRAVSSNPAVTLARAINLSMSGLRTSEFSVVKQTGLGMNMALSKRVGYLV